MYGQVSEAVTPLQSGLRRLPDEFGMSRPAMSELRMR